MLLKLSNQRLWDGRGIKTHGEMRNVYKTCRKPEGKRPLGKPRRRRIILKLKLNRV
jgi:hypothetical protein